MIHLTTCRRSSRRRRRQRGRRLRFREARRELGRLASDLDAISRRIDRFVGRLPRNGGRFDPLAELGEGAGCVRADLLSDAVETLVALATLETAELRRRFEERQRWLEG